MDCTLEVLSIKICTVCNKHQNIDQYVGEKGNTTKTCCTCRLKYKMYDKNRNKEERNAKARIAEAKEERKQKKKEWTVNVRYKSKQYHYSIYKTHAHERNLCFELSMDEYLNIISKNCNYCNGINEVGFNGVDRKNNTIGYTIENSVSCCSICNFMKKTTHSDIFIQRAIHIAQYAIDYNQLYPEIFIDHNIVHYCSYNTRSIRRYGIEINKQFYKTIVSQPCYLCGKEPTQTHKNGIDRFDNYIGYTEDNCRSCCGDCNMMKRDYSHELVIQQCNNIAKNNSNKIV
jgi:hypothetical protein